MVVTGFFVLCGYMLDVKIPRAFETVQLPSVVNSVWTAGNKEQFMVRRSYVQIFDE